MGQESQAVANGYGIPEVAEILDLPARRVRAWVKAGWIVPARSPDGHARLSFRDVALLRSIRDLEASRVPPRRVRRALERLRDAAGGESLDLGLRASAGEVVVRDGDSLWSPESGQCLFDFDTRRPGAPVVNLTRDDDRDGEHWFELAGQLEGRDPEGAREAYGRALAADPTHADAHLNLGCLEHECGRLEAAESHYRSALALRPADVTAHFNLGVALEDLGRCEDARAAYESAVASDPSHAEAHFNLARLCERLADGAGALRHWTAYRRLSRD
jgi:tetratricopeptide (TPR) repeat protein